MTTKKLLNGITIKEPLYALDWSRKKVDVYNPHTGNEKFKNIEEVARTLAQRHPDGCSLVLESTTESYELDRRKVVLTALNEANIDTYSYDPRHTKNFRLDNDIEKSDPADARVIYFVATETKKSLKRFGLLREPVQEGGPRDPLGSRIFKFVILDRPYEGKKTLEYAIKYLGKPLTKTQVKKGMVPTVVVPSEYHDFIYGGGGKYRKQIGRFLYAAEEVRNEGRGLRPFRRLVANYSNGFGSIMRSEYYHWWIESILKAKMKERGIKLERKPVIKRGKATTVRIWTEEARALRREVMTQAQKVVNYLWHLTATHKEPEETLFSSVAS
jgi:hypothetical protein